jgi:hypothetical protein
VTTTAGWPVYQQPEGRPDSVSDRAICWRCCLFINLHDLGIDIAGIFWGLGLVSLILSGAFRLISGDAELEWPAWRKLAAQSTDNFPKWSTRQMLVLRITTTFALAGSLVASLNSSQTANERLPANEFVRQIIDNELQAEQKDHSLWMLRLETQESGKAEVREVVETKNGDLDWLISVNGKSLPEEQQHERERGIQRLVSNPAELQKSQKERDEDVARSQRLLKILPDAFVFDYGERRRDFQELKFKPNPHFRSPSHEAAAFHAMEGTLWVNATQKRLAEISGHLKRAVRFAGGLLGHLDAGGQFYVKQEEVQPGYWELAVLSVDLKGRALFFKTIGVQEKLERSEFRRLPDDLTAAQGAELLYQQVRTGNGGVRGQ